VVFLLALVIRLSYVWFSCTQYPLSLHFPRMIFWYAYYHSNYNWKEIFADILLMFLVSLLNRLYQNPVLFGAASKAFWTSCHVISKLLWCPGTCWDPLLYSCVCCHCSLEFHLWVILFMLQTNWFPWHDLICKYSSLSSISECQFKFIGKMRSR
jgi:hypothetical protein